MSKYEVRYGLSGGFGGCCEWELAPGCETIREAEEYAIEMACQEYDSYGGLHGLFRASEALEEDPDLTEMELDEMYLEDRESWITYDFREVKDD